jgi:hypothetical protein
VEGRSETDLFIYIYNTYFSVARYGTTEYL